MITLKQIHTMENAMPLDTKVSVTFHHLGMNTAVNTTHGDLLEYVRVARKAMKKDKQSLIDQRLTNWLDDCQRVDVLFAGCDTMGLLLNPSTGETKSWQNHCTDLCMMAAARFAAYEEEFRCTLRSQGLVAQNPDNYNKDCVPTAADDAILKGSAYAQQVVTH